jgi:uncharacterized membrane protein YeaQ/YmgE (transglycosylase-associated protein family)
LIGYLGAMTVGAATWRGVLLNILVGICGTLVGGRLLAPLTGGSVVFAEGPFDVASFAVALASAGSLLVVANLIRRHVRG